MPLWLLLVRLAEGLVAGGIWTYAEERYTTYCRRIGRPTILAGGAAVASAFLFTCGVELVSGLYRHPGYWPWFLGLSNVISYKAGLSRGRSERAEGGSAE